MAVFFSDYFSPLFVGAVMRNLTDRFRISREKLAYICDSTSASILVLVPISGWAVYLTGITIGAPGIADQATAMSLFIRSVPYNFYGYVTVLMVFLISLEVLPDFGPMRTAEVRARDTGKVLRDGAVPMMGKELTDLQVTSSPHTNILLNFIVPVVLIVGTNIGTFIVRGTASVLESFMLASATLGVIMWLQRVDTIRGLMQTAMAGMKGVMAAVAILALAYCINTVSRELQTAAYVVGLTEAWCRPPWSPSSRSS